MHFVFPFGDVPEEAKQQIEKWQAEQHQRQMATELGRHELVRVVEELDDEQLKTLKTLLGQIAQAPDARAAAFFWHGFAVCLSHTRGVCAACGTNHTEAFQEPPAAGPKGGVE